MKHYNAMRQNASECISGFASQRDVMRASHACKSVSDAAPTDDDVPVSNRSESFAWLLAWLSAPSLDDVNLDFTKRSPAVKPTA